MNLIVMKIVFCMVLMIAFLIMALITKDAISRQLFASLGILTGTYASKSMLESSKAEKIE